MKRPQFVFRPNLRDPAQRRAWQLLQAQPAGERSAYLASCILKSDDRAAVQKELRKVLKEELGKIQVTAPAADPKQKMAVPKSTLDFFTALQEDVLEYPPRIAAETQNTAKELRFAFGWPKGDEWKWLYFEWNEPATTPS